MHTGHYQLDGTFTDWQSGGSRVRVPSPPPKVLVTGVCGCGDSFRAGANVAKCSHTAGTGVRKESCLRCSSKTSTWPLDELDLPLVDLGIIGCVRFPKDFLPDREVSPLVTGEVLLDQLAVNAAHVGERVGQVLANVDLPAGYVIL